jgi:hypothetical protein
MKLWYLRRPVVQLAELVFASSSLVDLDEFAQWAAKSTTQIAAAASEERPNFSAKTTAHSG